MQGDVIGPTRTPPLASSAVYECTDGSKLCFYVLTFTMLDEHVFSGARKTYDGLSALILDGNGM